MERASQHAGAGKRGSGQHGHALELTLRACARIGLQKCLCRDGLKFAATGSTRTIVGSYVEGVDSRDRDLNNGLVLDCKIAQRPRRRSLAGPFSLAFARRRRTAAAGLVGTRRTPAAVVAILATTTTGSGSVLGIEVPHCRKLGETQVPAHTSSDPNGAGCAAGCKDHLGKVGERGEGALDKRVLYPLVQVVSRVEVDWGRACCSGSGGGGQRRVEAMLRPFLDKRIRRLWRIPPGQTGRCVQLAAEAVLCLHAAALRQRGVPREGRQRRACGGGIGAGAGAAADTFGPDVVGDLTPFHLGIAGLALHWQLVDKTREHPVDWPELCNLERCLVQRTAVVVFKPDLDARSAEDLACREKDGERRGGEGRSGEKRNNSEKGEKCCCYLYRWLKKKAPPTGGWGVVYRRRAASESAACVRNRRAR